MELFGNNRPENTICIMSAPLGEECITLKTYQAKENVKAKANELRSAPEASKIITE